MFEEFIIDSALASPIEQDDVSTSTLNITQLSLPESFDDTFCFDLHNDKGISRSGGDSLCSKRQGQLESRGKLKERTLGHDDLELKIRELHAINLNLQEKGRNYDRLKKRSSEQKDEVEALRTQMQEQSTLYESALQREKESHHQILECKRKAELLEMDLDHSRKEAEVFLSRAEKAEKDHEDSSSALRHAQQKHDNSINRITKERDEIKTNSEREIARIREESSQEAIAMRNNQKESFSREAKLLCDARDHAFEQTKSLQLELNDLRMERETKEAENADIIKELERQLSDVRSDLKVKTCELNTLQTCQDRITAEAKQYKEKNEKNKEALANLRKEHTKLDRETTIEINKLEEMVRQKNEDLEFYRQDDLLIKFNNENDENAENGIIPGRRSLVKNSVALAKKCRDLQLQFNRINIELAAEKEENVALSRKEESNQRLLQELTAKNNASAYIISAVATRDREIQELSSKVHELRTELEETKKERDRLYMQLTQTLGRRDQLDEMKAIIESMKSANLLSSKRNDDIKASMEKTRNKDDDTEDLLDHLVHRGKKSRESTQNAAWLHPQR